MFVLNKLKGIFERNTFSSKEKTVNFVLIYSMFSDIYNYTMKLFKI